jgi:hypothetical protein
MRGGATGDRLLSVRIEHGAVLVAFVQRVVSSFDKDFGPFDEGSSEETGKGANKDFLEEGRVHPFLTATMVPVSQLFAEDVDPRLVS